MNMKLMMIDLDGTLFDTRLINYLSYKESLALYGFDIDYQYYCEHCNGRHYLEFLPKITTSNSIILSDIHEKKKEFYKNFLEYAKINQSLIDIIRFSKKEYYIALVTTASRENTYDILEKFGIVDLFDLILTHEDITYIKPNPEGYLKAMEYFEIDAENSIIFEDSKVGIEAAKKTGADYYIVRGYN